MRIPNASPAAVAVVAYLLACYALALWAFVLGGAGPGDLFPGAVFFLITLPASAAVLVPLFASDRVPPDAVLSLVLVVLPAANAAFTLALFRLSRRLRGAVR